MSHQQTTFADIPATVRNPGISLNNAIISQLNLKLDQNEINNIHIHVNLYGFIHENMSEDNTPLCYSVSETIIGILSNLTTNHLPHGLVVKFIDLLEELKIPPMLSTIDNHIMFRYGRYMHRKGEPAHIIKLSEDQSYKTYFEYGIPINPPTEQSNKK